MSVEKETAVILWRVIKTAAIWEEKTAVVYVEKIKRSSVGASALD